MHSRLLKKRKFIKKIPIKSEWEVERMRIANRIVAEVLLVLKEVICAGMSTKDLDNIAREEIEKRGARPAFLGYHGYPASLCVSVNSEVVHGIPSSHRLLAEGDLVSLDLGSIYEDYYGDAAISVCVGEPSKRVKDLLDITENSLYEGISKARAGNRVQDISFAIQNFVESRGYFVVKKFVGHGIGRNLHEPPEVPNYGKPGQGPLLKPGMCIAIEPMVNEGTSEVRVLADGWTAVTVDGSLSAHFEHTILITKGEAEILSKV